MKAPLRYSKLLRPMLVLRCVFLFSALSGWVPAATQTALDRYVARPDPSFRYKLVNTSPGKGFTVHLLQMTSQSWRSPSEVDRPVWEHWLTIVKPDRVETSTALLFIGGGKNDGKLPRTADAMLRSIAAETQSVVAELRMVPNQPLTFSDGKPREEDEVIAYTWDKFLKTHDETWPLRLPMTKSAVRAMDAITAFCASDQGGQIRVNRYVVAGGSKRGWTTWTTAAVDRRVVAIVPIVIDVLNIEKSMIHHYRAYGFWAPAVHDYEEMGIMQWMGKPQSKPLWKIEEPYEYRDRLTMPKFMVNSTGDQFFLPDSSQFYFGELRGEKFLRYVPNTDHSLRNSDATESLQAYYAAFLRNTPRPDFAWNLERDGSIRVTARTRPAEVKLWQASNPKARDFRLETLGPVWSSTNLEAQRPGVYLAKVQKPASGWTAFLVELTFPSGGKFPFKFTTPVRVIPDNLPYPPPK